MDPAIDQGDAPVGGGGNLRAMGDEDDGGFLLAGKLGDEFDDGDTGGRIEIACGFIGEKDGGLMNESPGEGGALKLAARELMGPMMRAIVEPNGR